MKTIQATNDKTKYALVDNDVAEIIQEMGLKFCIMNNGYFRSTSHMIKLPGMTEKKQLYLHQFVYIIKTKTEPMSSLDHIDINKSNNQFLNLRLATIQQQNQHQSKKKSNTSGFIGVCHKHTNKKYKDKTYENDYWQADIQRPDNKHETKTFPYTSEGKIAAASWRDKKAREYYKEFHGELNFPDENQ